MKDQSYSSDKAVNTEFEDKFQRFGFAKRIAQTISNSDTQDGLVIGIYGAWGNGKTSVINFINTVLSQDENIIRITFNPWRYSDENSLLISFFHTLAGSLDKELKSGKEKVGDIIGKYSRFLKFDLPLIGGNLGETGENIGNILGSVDIEELKARLETIIIDSQKKIVIFIDDIDRLDKQEIYSVFRLVKLTADFKNSTYILSFDEDVVASALSERFGSSNTQSGRSFLEKIIQVPLHLPKAQPDALKDFCLKKIVQLFEVNNLDLDKEETGRYGYIFSTYLLKRFETPRLIVRYINSLSFSLPLLNGEVNLVDLMIIEAIKIIYPDVYEFIEKHPQYIIVHPVKYDGRSDDDKKQEIKNHISNLISKYDPVEQKNIEGLLLEIFPQLKTVYQNMSYPDGKYVKWNKDKRICSPQYFNRYFSYCVIKGELSDVSFETFISNISTQEEDSIKTSLAKLMENSSWDILLQKLRIIENDTSWNEYQKLSLVLIKNVKGIEYNKANYFFSTLSPIGQLVYFISKGLYSSDASVEDKLEFAKKLVCQTDSIDFAYDLLRNFNPEGNEDQKCFDKEQFVTIWKALHNRVLTEAKCNEKDIFEKYPEEAYYICKFWEGYDREGFNVYVKEIVNSNNQKIIAVLRTYLPRFRSLGNERTHDGNIEEKTYEYLVSILDKNYIAETLTKVYGRDNIESNPPFWNEREDYHLNDLDMVRQFFHWYNLEGQNKD